MEKCRMKRCQMAHGGCDQGVSVHTGDAAVSMRLVSPNDGDRRIGSIGCQNKDIAHFEFDILVSATR